MSHRRNPKTKAIIAAAGVVALGGAAILLPNAMASQDKPQAAAPKTLKSGEASDLASQLAEALGEAFGGSYFDSDKGQVIINVVDGDDNNIIQQVKDAGAVPREVDNSWSSLKAAAKTLKADATIPGTAWALDPRTNQVQVTADSTVTDANWDKLTSTVKSLGDGMATVKKSAGTFKTFVDGGDAIFGGGARCSLGFNVAAGDGSPAFLTAGHCGVAAAEWSDSEQGQPLATVDQATFPGEGDFALVKYDDATTQTNSVVNVGNGQTVEITQAAEAEVGQQVIRMGSTTGLNDGAVTGLDATVNYPEGTVTGLIQTDVCAEPGDSGGPLFTQDGSAIGLTSGGSGDCTAGGETFFQPVTTALEATGATLGAGGGDAGAGGEDGDDAGAGIGGEASNPPADQGGEEQAGDDAGAGAGGADGGEASTPPADQGGEEAGAGEEAGDGGDAHGNGEADAGDEAANPPADQGAQNGEEGAEEGADNGANDHQ